VIFHDATLAELARSAPESLDELAEVPGIGASKLERYGEEILEILRGLSVRAPGSSGIPLDHCQAAC
jgi:ATP-dependent DNA helicase RecQ